MFVIRQVRLYRSPQYSGGRNTMSVVSLNCTDYLSSVVCIPRFHYGPSKSQLSSQLITDVHQKNLQTDLVFQPQSINYLTTSIGSIQRPQGAPDLVQFGMGVPQLDLKLRHHTLVLLLLTAVEILQLPVFFCNRSHTITHTHTLHAPRDMHFNT